MSDKGRIFSAPAAPAIAAALLSLLVYAVGLGGTYVYDDRSIVQGDPRLLHPRQWRELWTQPYAPGAADNLYRPLVSMTYAIQWWLHGDRPWAFHLVNILLHAAVAAAVAELTRRAVGQTPAYIAGLLFAAHPIHVEAVANIVGRAELMCALGILGAMVLFRRRPLTTSRVIGIFICAVAAILSKEQGILLPPILFFYGWFVWRASGAPDSRERTSLAWLAIALTWSTASYMLLREHFLKFDWDRSFLNWSMQPMILSVGIDRWLMPIVLLGHYFQLLIFPITLSPDYGAGVIGSGVLVSDPYLWVGMGVLFAWLTLTGLGVWKWQASPPSSAVQGDGVPLPCRGCAGLGFLLFCLLSMGVAYLLVGNVVVLIGVNMAERLMYLPSAFFLMGVGVCIARVPWRIRTWVVAGVLAMASWRTFDYARLWNDRLQFYVHSLHEQPRSIQLWLLAGDEYRQNGELKSAEIIFALGTSAFPDDWQLWARRATVAIDDGRIDDAERYLRESIAIKPDMSQLDLQERLQKLKPTTTPTAGQSEGTP